MIMRRSLSEFASLGAIKHTIYIPSVVQQIANWWPFLLNYIGVKNYGAVYRLRNGIEIETGEGVDAATIAVVFVKKAYGDAKDNTTIIDIGANIGVYAVYAAGTSKNTKVYAYEPLPRSYSLLLKNMQRNRLQKFIFPFRVGVAGSRGRRQLFLANGSPFHSFYRTQEGKGHVEIGCITLQEIFDENNIEQCDVLKIDCEGAEFEILLNTPLTYLAKIQEIRMECHDVGGGELQRARLLAYLKAGGFRLVRFTQDTPTSSTWWLQKA